LCAHGFAVASLLAPAALDDLLLADVLGRGGLDRLVAGSAEGLALATLELESERVDLLLELGDGVVIEDVRLAQRVEDGGVAAQVVEQLALEAQDVLDLDRVELAVGPAQIETTCSSTGYGEYCGCLSSSVRRAPRASWRRDAASRSLANIANASSERYWASSSLSVPETFLIDLT
jgi:hypothetical protein